MIKGFCAFLLRLFGSKFSEGCEPSLTQARLRHPVMIYLRRQGFCNFLLELMTYIVSRRKSAHNPGFLCPLLGSSLSQSGGGRRSSQLIISRAVHSYPTPRRPQHCTCCSFKGKAHRGPGFTPSREPLAVCVGTSLYGFFVFNSHSFAL